MTILDELAAYARKRVAEDKITVPVEKLRAQCIKMLAAEDSGTFKYGRFAKALMNPGLGIIAEIKKASPSKGLISPEFPYLQIARDYETAGADCISCLTEPHWFLGSDEIFREIRREVSIPMIRKDFTVDAYQLYQAKMMGADCVLLIMSILNMETVRDFIGICDTLHMDALVETHSVDEIAAAEQAGARIIGVNNRNLKDFTVDFSNAVHLRDRIPAGCIYVAESGVKGPEDTKLLKEIGADAALIGETLMRAEDKKTMLLRLKEA